ncbi:MAG: preprotein translocase subunit SecE [Micropruina sp.]
MADDQDPNLTPGSDSAVNEPVDNDLPGELLANEHLAEAEPYEISSDEFEAEELSESDADDVDEQLIAAEVTARAAASTRPVRRTVSEAPAKKDHPTPRRSRAQTKERVKRTTPAQFVRESAGELRKVVRPTATQLRQYFVVVLVFVLLIIGFVTALDLLYGWALLTLFG